MNKIYEKGKAMVAGAAFVFAGSALASGAPLDVDGGFRSYNVRDGGTYVIHLASTTPGGKSEGSLCIEGPSRPGDPCRHFIDRNLQSWAGDWVVNLSAGQQLTVWTKEGDHAVGPSSTDRPTGRVSSMHWSDNGFEITFTITPR